MKKLFLVMLFVLLLISICSASSLEVKWDLADTNTSDITTVIEIMPVVAGPSGAASWSVLTSVPNGGTSWIGELDNSVYPRGSSFQLRAKATRNGVDSQGNAVLLESPYCEAVTAFVSSATPGKPNITIVITQ